MTSLQTERTTFIGKLHRLLHSWPIQALAAILNIISSLQNWSWWTFWQKRSCYQLCHWGGQEDSSGHWDVLQYNCGGDAYERCRSDLSPEKFIIIIFFFIKKKGSDSDRPLALCLYYSRGEKYFSMLNLGSDFFGMCLKERWLYAGPSWTVVDSNLDSRLVGAIKTWGL